MSYRVQNFTLTGMVSLLFLAMPHAFAEDAYTDALNAEAETLSVDPGTSKEQQARERSAVPGGSFASGWSRDDQTISDDLPKGA